MYINFWYPMIRSEDLGPGKPEKVKVLGLNFAVFRNAAGEAVTLSDTCVHRGGSLSGPWELNQQPRCRIDDHDLALNLNVSRIEEPRAHQCEYADHEWKYQQANDEGTCGHSSDKLAFGDRKNVSHAVASARISARSCASSAASSELEATS